MHQLDCLMIENYNANLRKDSNSATNNYGLRLITLCKSKMFTLLMVGLGSIGTEVQIHAKMQALFLVSPQSFHNTIEFEVLECDELLSDVYNPFKMAFNYTMQHPNVPTIREDELAENDDTAQFNKPKWVKDCESGFKNRS